MAFWKDTIVEQYRQMPPGRRIALWVVAISFLPLICLLGNLTFTNFAVDGAPYQHMHMIDRVLEGKSPYSPVSTDHAAVTYTPLYWWINALLFKITGPSFPVARLASIFFAILTGFLVAGFVWNSTGKNLTLSLAAPVMVLSTSLLEGFNGWVWDVNVNALHVALVVLGFYLLRDPLTVRSAVLAALALSAGVLAKQTGIAYVVAAAAFLLLRRSRLCAVFSGVALLALAATFTYLNVSTNGEFYAQTATANQGPPWSPERLFREVLLGSFAGLFGFMTLTTVIRLLKDTEDGFWRGVLKSEYVMCAAGIAVACIAHPKFGSGATHDVVGLSGLAVCGCAGVHTLSSELKGRLADRVRVWVPLLQIGVVMLSAIGTYPYLLVDGYDRQKNDEIAQVFRSGRTCLFGVPYIQKMYGQPLSGYPDDEPSKWRNGRLDYSGLPPSLSDPFRNEVFDYVIIGPYWDPAHPVAKAIMGHYKAVVAKLPAHPGIPGQGGSMRHEMFILKANRLLGQEAGQATGPLVP